MKLDVNAPFIEVHADWYKSNPAKTTSYEKAAYDVKKGYAEVIAPNAIKLVKRTKPVKEIVLERDNHVCQYCGKYGNTVDHIIPKSKYLMYTTEEMLVCACWRCTIHEFLKDLMKQEIIQMIDERWRK